MSHLPRRPHSPPEPGEYRSDNDRMSKRRSISPDARPLRRPGPPGRWGSPPPSAHRPNLVDRYAGSKALGRRASTPPSRGSPNGSRASMSAAQREFPREPVFKGLDGLTEYLTKTVMAKAKVEQAARALSSIKKFQPDESTLSEAESALADAESALNAECEHLQDAFVNLLQQALAVPGVKEGDISGLNVDDLKARVSRLEERASQTGLTEQEIQAFVNASGSLNKLSEDDVRKIVDTKLGEAKPVTAEEVRAVVAAQALSEDQIRDIVRREGLSEEKAREIIRAHNMSEEQVQQMIMGARLNPEQIRAVVGVAQKNASPGLSEEQVRAIVSSIIPTSLAASTGTKALTPKTEDSKATTDGGKGKAADSTVKPEASTGERTQIRLRELLQEVLTRLEAVESMVEERYEHIQSDIDDQRSDLQVAVGRYERAADRRAAKSNLASASGTATPAAPPAAPASAIPPSSIPAPPTSTPPPPPPSSQPSASSSDLAALRAEMEAMRSQMTSMSTELSTLRSEVSTLRSTASKADLLAGLPQKMSQDLDQKLVAWKSAILKDIEDWIKAKMPGIVAPVMEELKKKVMAQMIIEARGGAGGAGGMGGAGGVGGGGGVGGTGRMARSATTTPIVGATGNMSPGVPQRFNPPTTQTAYGFTTPYQPGHPSYSSQRPA